MFPICICTLHHIHTQSDSLTISPTMLQKAILRILDMGFTFITYGEFIEAILQNKNIGKKKVLLTFDDGYFDLYRFGFPILKELKIPAVCFLITNTIRNSKREIYDLEPKLHKDFNYSNDLEYFLNLSEILEMHASGLMEFDSHSATHFSCNSEDTERLKQELTHSRDKISEIFPHKKHFGFCFPRGDFNANALNLLSTCGYDFAFSTIDGGLCKGDDLRRIRRIDISQSTRKEADYLFRLSKKLNLYSYPLLGNLYSNFRNRKFHRVP
ncbi:polysaccharide deacetylase family protein [Helicobacter ganmani]|uniref:polysaccharide deacetylase family protein n=1 Tax=Helicobacter ganmani TaxID=60246 RepID=UPI003A87FCEF